MQIFALDEQNYLIAAHQALRQQDYRCVECRGLLRLRGGFHKQLHYYHLHERKNCYLNNKSLTHLKIQFYIQKKLHLLDTSLEYRFPQIQRIADVYWPEKNLVFEIQCSKIPIQELLSRTQDYHSIGIEIVWIFHDRCFSNFSLLQMEEIIREIPHYFTNFNSKGEGTIYDNFLHTSNSKLKKIIPPLEIDLSFPKKISTRPDRLLSELLPRVQYWKIYFKNDLLDRFQDPAFQSLIPDLNHDSSSIGRYSFKKIGFWFRNIFDSWVETHCSSDE
jgi:competence protein CoiA